MVSVDGLTVEFGGTTLFKDISFVINDKDRIALMGKNGAGKSTLLKILAGIKTPTRGKVSVTDGGKIGYLPQHLMRTGVQFLRRQHRLLNIFLQLKGRLRSSTTSLQPAQIMTARNIWL